MSQPLEHCGKIEIRESPVEGFGVFANALIKKGEIIERTPFIMLPRFMGLGKNLYDMLCQTGFVSQKEQYIENLRHNLGHKDVEKYLFKWMAPVGLNDGPITWTCLPLGATCIINTSNTNNNCGWRIESKTFVFTAERDIEPGFELFSFYGYYMGENGSIWNCNEVFNLAMDKDESENRYKVKSIRFGDVGQFEASKQNPSYQKLFQIIQNTKNGFSITRISGASIDTVERAFQEINDSMPMSFVYSKLREFCLSPLPFIKINLKYNHKDTGAEVVDEVVFRK